MGMVREGTGGLDMYVAGGEDGGSRQRNSRVPTTCSKEDERKVTIPLSG